MNLGRTRSLFYDNLLELLFSRDQAEIPDGLIVQNENFLPIVMNAFSRLGIIPGTHVKIVSHGNLPIVSPRVAGVDYIYFRIDEVLSESMRLLEQWKTGKLNNKIVNVLIPPADDVVQAI
eukprot:TRINITY_DN6060_c0_g1_i3.p3 TRINITY_DN6060_c0_g1~~TRINITY_DN6060_c0_g1_i3.p3  ORF type:complete len:127 (-),score=11.81 TRINITY_DN6060_c0_g1_i3:206-565(-)